MAPGAKAPRLSEFTVALCVALRDGGMSYRDIAKHRLVKKRDGTHPTYQAVMKVLKVHATARRSARWRMNGAGKKPRGRPRKKITEAQKREMTKLIAKNPGVIRSPHLKRKLKLKCSERTIRRAVASLGYSVYKRGSKKVLSTRTKKLRVKWAQEHEARTPVWWKNRGFADGHFWFHPRSRLEASTPRPKGSSVLRKRGEGAAPKHQGGKGSAYKQGKRIGVWGVLTTEGLRVAFLPKSRLTGAIHASTVRKHYAAWAGWAQGIVHDGERALWAPAAKRAYKEAGVPPLKHPPTSPDLNPIENAWALLDRRLEETRPETFEPENKFRARVHAATRYLNAGRRLPSLQRLVGSMRSRVKYVLRVKGAMTRY